MTDCGTMDGQLVETTYKHLFDNSPNAVVFCNLDGVILFTNAAFERLFGFCETEITGHRLKKVLRPLNREFDEPAEWANPHAVEYFPSKRLCADNTLVDVAISFFPVTISHKIQGTYIIYQSMTQLCKFQTIPATDST